VVQVPTQGRQGEVAYLCEACLERRIARVRAAPPPPPPRAGRGRKKTRRDPEDAA
jgi:hypothetical protein